MRNELAEKRQQMVLIPNSQHSSSAGTYAIVISWQRLSALTAVCWGHACHARKWFSTTFWSTCIIEFYRQRTGVSLPSIVPRQTTVL